MNEIKVQSCKVNFWQFLLIFSMILSAACSRGGANGSRKGAQDFKVVLSVLKEKYGDPSNNTSSQKFEDFFRDTLNHNSLFDILKNENEAIYVRMGALSTIVGSGIESSISKKAYSYALNAEKFQEYDQISQLAGMGLNSCFLLDDTIMKKWFQIWKTLDWTPRSNLINVLYKCRMGNDLPKTYLLDALSVSSGPRGRSLLIIKEKETLDADYREALEKILVSDQIRRVTKKEVQEVLDKFDQ